VKTDNNLFQPDDPIPNQGTKIDQNLNRIWNSGQKVQLRLKVIAVK